MKTNFMYNKKNKVVAANYQEDKITALTKAVLQSYAITNYRVR